MQIFSPLCRFNINACLFISMCARIYFLVTVPLFHIFIGIPRLQTLDISGNNLAVLRGPTFSNLTNLEELYMRRNNIRDIAKGLFSK